MKRKIFQKDFKKYMRQALRGDEYAQTQIGRMYYEGKEGFISKFLYGGESVKQDYQKAFEWYLKAASPKTTTFFGEFDPSLGNRDAQSRIADMYYDGKGVRQNYQEAFKWYMSAVDNDNCPISQILPGEDDHAKIRIGDMYYEGKGTEKDYLKAFEWYLKAASPKITRIYDESRPFPGDINAQCKVASMYYEGKGVEKDYQKAFEWYLKAASRKDADAQYRIALMYYRGEDVEKSYHKAVEWCSKAVDNGSSKAIRFLEALEGKNIHWVMIEERPPGRFSTCEYVAGNILIRVRYDQEDLSLGASFDIYHYNGSREIYFSKSTAEISGRFNTIKELSGFLSLNYNDFFNSTDDTELAKLIRSRTPLRKIISF